MKVKTEVGLERVMVYVVTLPSGKSGGRKKI